LASGPSECRLRGSLEFSQGLLRSKLLRRQRRTALVREAYIVATNQNCQQSSTMFFRFLVEISTGRKFVSWLG
ncbi:hypothetical protein, partial [Mesorhizobium sp. LNJC380A00]|uniref:hypothetical protein n=1 Tax=Mesorhizobium sp. LNJC380A00 TaxID=1287264 RepID=UPI001AEC0645